MTNLTKFKLAWKYRTQLWKHRRMIRRRKQIAAFAAAGAGIAVAFFAFKPHH